MTRLASPSLPTLPSLPAERPMERRSYSWDQRIERAEHLGKTYPFAAEFLFFYRELACFQKSIQQALDSADSTSGAGIRSKEKAAVWPESVNAALLLPWFPTLLELVERVGTPKLVEAAGALAQQDHRCWEELIASGWRDDSRPPETSYDARAFFARVLLEPYAESHAARTELTSPRSGDNTCPFCRRRPQVGVLRPEGYGARRSLVCSLCATEWDYRRILCPACGEDRFDRLPVYTADQFAHVRVEACDTCKTYLKTVDLTRDGLAVPAVDELAATPLDLWAAEKGYRKRETNLLGL